MSEVAPVEGHDVEVVVPMDRHSAEQLDKRIRLIAGTVRDNFVKLAAFVEEAKAGNIHEVLGFASWTAYLADALGGQLEVKGPVRLEVVQFLAGEGMSTRGIAAITGASKSTIANDLAQVSNSGHVDLGGDQSAVPNGTPADEQKTVGLDGKEYRKPNPRKKPEPKPAPAVAAPAARAVQIPTAYREIVGGFTRPIEDLFALTRDPRWAKAVQRFNLKDRDTLDRTIDGLQEFRAAMNKQPEEQNPPTPAAEVEEVATTSVPVEPEVVQQVTATPIPARPTNCDRCNVDLPASATEPLCDDCDGAPEAPAPDATVEPPAVVVHNEAISKRSHQRRRFSGRKVTA